MTAAIGGGSAEAWTVWRHRLPAHRWGNGHPPPGWRVLREGADGCAYVLAAGRAATVLESVAREQDGRVWHHVSLARKDRCPTWEELAAAKQAFVGDREAYCVLPEQRNYVNLHLRCLHLWSCLEAPGGRVLPDFTRGTGSI